LDWDGGAPADVGPAVDASTVLDAQVPVDAGLADSGPVADAGHLADAASGTDAALPIDGGSDTDGGPEAPPACAYRRFSPPDDYALFALQAGIALSDSIGEGPRTLEFWLPNLEPPAEGSERIDEVSLSTIGFDRMAGQINMSAFANSQGLGTQYVGVWEPPENFDLQSPAHVAIVYEPGAVPVLRFYLRGERQQLAVRDAWHQGCAQNNVIAGARCGNSGEVRTTATRLGPLRLSSVASLYDEPTHPIPEFELRALDSTVLLLSPTSMEFGAWTDLSGTGRHGTVSGAPECFSGIARNGSSERAAARTCSTLHDDYPNLESGIYWIDPDGEGGDSAWQAYCEMDADGGGWTRMVMVARGQTLWNAWSQARNSDSSGDNQATFGIPIQKLSNSDTGEDLEYLIHFDDTRIHHLYRSINYQAWDLSLDWDESTANPFDDHFQFKAVGEQSWRDCNAAGLTHHNARWNWSFGSRNGSCGDAIDNQGFVLHGVFPAETLETAAVFYSNGYVGNSEWAWVEFFVRKFVKPNGSSAEQAAHTCSTLHDDYPNLESGIYWIDPDGDGGTQAYRARCDMDTLGGGWTIVKRWGSGANYSNSLFMSNTNSMGRSASEQGSVEDSTYAVPYEGALDEANEVLLGWEFTQQNEVEHATGYVYWDASLNDFNPGADTMDRCSNQGFWTHRQGGCEYSNGDASVLGQSHIFTMSSWLIGDLEGTNTDWCSSRAWDDEAGLTIPNPGGEPSGNIQCPNYDNGHIWIAARRMVRPDGSSAEQAGPSCKAIKDDHPNSPSAAYWLDPDGEGDAPAYRVWCDMEYNGGGWQLVTIISNANNQILGNGDYFPFVAGQHVTASPDDTDALGSVPVTQPFREIMLRIQDQPGWHMRYVADSVADVHSSIKQHYADLLEHDVAGITMGDRTRWEFYAKAGPGADEIGLGHPTLEGFNCNSRNVSANRRFPLACNTGRLAGELRAYDRVRDESEHHVENIPNGTSFTSTDKLVLWVR
jgi:hypothetical protein